MTAAVPDDFPTDPGATPDLPAETPITDYTDAVAAFLSAADWLTALDQPLVVHAKAIARSLDRQLSSDGVVQSALASSFDKAMVRLNAHRPPPAPRPPGLGDAGPMGEQSIFTFGLDGET